MATLTSQARPKLGRGGGFGVAIDQRRLKRDARRIEKALRSLGAESRQRTVIRKALGPATTPMNKDAKRRAPKDTGQYRKSIGKKTATYKATGSVVVVIGPRTGFKTVDAEGRPHDPAMIGHLLERGHGGPRPAPPHPHLRPAFDAKSTGAQRLFVRGFWPVFDKELARVRAKEGR